MYQTEQWLLWGGEVTGIVATGDRFFFFCNMYFFIEV